MTITDPALPDTTTPPVTPPLTPPATPVREWLADFAPAVAAADEGAIAACFTDGATVRDLLVLEWDFTNRTGAAAIGERFASAPRARALADFQVRMDDLGEPEAWYDDARGPSAVSAFIAFTTDVGSGDGYLQLEQAEDGRWLASALVTELVELSGRGERIGASRPAGKHHGPVRGRPTWPDERAADQAWTDPAVVVIGGGHSGLAIAARFGRLGVPCLVLERNAAVGDNWRNRYAALALHDPVGADHLPYLPLPSTWPNFTPAGKFGDYLRSYADLLDIAVLTGVEVTGARPSDEGGWQVDLVDADGGTRSLHPRHVVVATGFNNLPAMPDIPGREVFRGQVCHSSEFAGAAGWTGRRVVVVGTGVSGHDIAQDLAEQGVADVVMVQRGPTYVINAGTFHQQFFANYLEGVRRTADADLMGAALPFGMYPAFGPTLVAAAREQDRETLEGLAAAGFRLGWGPNGEGINGLVFRENRTGYYYNIGASDLIIDGSIRVAQGPVTRFSASGVVLEDGTELEADLVVFATGFRSAKESSRPLLGDLTDELPEICTVGEDREYTAVWRGCGVPGLWFMVSTGIFASRFYSKHLALQILAIEEGLTAQG
ncbi:SidA/IucD/PvdA family monooxygenase [Nakamurella sp. YIM 132087]|uniref:SidA/IucD/PvdA family monooxygenase n=1 Tax=Nakamurella alba TaxID=2665158 RepID=A0A7K1FQ83_9ACTN|nr:NAD(P)/FAD-dependent oxidoreductase [Nakamurella alba]MTD16308.1 SidA/IucD/PvdA family monooxygenase [Nakamurella alba]